MNIQTIPFNTFSLMKPRPQEWFEALIESAKLILELIIFVTQLADPLNPVILISIWAENDHPVVEII